MQDFKKTTWIQAIAGFIISFVIGMIVTLPILHWQQARADAQFYAESDARIAFCIAQMKINNQKLKQSIKQEQASSLETVWLFEHDQYISLGKDSWAAHFKPTKTVIYGDKIIYYMEREVIRGRGPGWICIVAGYKVSEPYIKHCIIQELKFDHDVVDVIKIPETDKQEIEKILRNKVKGRIEFW